MCPHHPAALPRPAMGLEIKLEPTELAPSAAQVSSVTAGVAPMNAQWPLTNRLSLAALPVAVPTARAEIKVLLIEWNLVELSESAELCVAELMGNAVKAVNDLRPDLRQPIVLRASSDYKRLLLEIWDCNPQPPPLEGQK